MSEDSGVVCNMLPRYVAVCIVHAKDMLAERRLPRSCARYTTCVSDPSKGRLQRDMLLVDQKDLGQLLNSEGENYFESQRTLVKLDRRIMIVEPIALYERLSALRALHKGQPAIRGIPPTVREFYRQHGYTREMNAFWEELDEWVKSDRMNYPEWRSL